ncbi:MAG TPA: hypothetical protein VIF62_00550 [Labilithrix sp.]
MTRWRTMDLAMPATARMWAAIAVVTAAACGNASVPPSRVDVGAARAAPLDVQSDRAPPPLGAPGVVLWARRYGGPGTLFPWTLAIDASDRLAIAGSFDKTADLGAFHLDAPKRAYGTPQGMFVAWLDASGNVTGARCFGDPGILGRAVLAAAPDGDWIVAGEFSGVLDFGAGPLDAAGTTTAFVARLGPMGAVRWSKKLGGAIQQRILDVAVSRAGEIVVAGTFNGGTLDLGGVLMPGHQLDDVFVAALRPDGTTRWARSYGDEWGQRVGAVAIDARGDIVLGGELEGTMDFGAGPIGTPADPKLGPTSNPAWIAKLDPDGGPRWSRVLSSKRSAIVRDLAIGRGGDIVASGIFFEDLRVGDLGVRGEGNTDGFIALLDSAGAPRWATRAGTDHNKDLEQAGNVAVDPRGNIAVFGSRTGSDDHSGPVYGMWLASFDALGATRFVRSHPHAMGDFLGHLLVTAKDGRAIALGSFGDPIDLGTGPLDGDRRSTSIFLVAFVP